MVKKFFWIRVSLANRVLYVACVYRPPSSDNSVFENLSKALEILQSRRGIPSIIIVGDLNCHNSDWLDSKDMNGCPQSNPAGITCHTFVTENALENLVYANTYLRNIGHSKSVQDLVITDIPNMCQIGYEAPIGKSPHITIACSVKFSTKKKTNLSPEQNGYIIKPIGNW
jgi:hypothetical protein